MSNSAGKGTPPKEHQFKKGKSGNPKGRPKKAKTISPETAISKIAATTFQSHKNGKVRELTAHELALTSIFNRAITGDRMAIREVIKWIKKRMEFRARQERKRRAHRVGIKIEAANPSNTDEALRLLNIISVSEERSDPSSGLIQYDIEPDVVQSELDRHRGGAKLDEETLSWIQAYTRDGSSVKLPRRYKQ